MRDGGVPRIAENMNEESIWNTLGEDGFRAIVHDFYIGVKTDDLLGPMYPPNDWEGAEKRFFDFLCFRIGAVERYIEERGHPRLRMRHMPFKIGVAERDRWMSLMNAALEKNVSDIAMRAELTTFFAQVADFMRNVPEAGKA